MAVLELALGILGMVPIFAIIKNMEDIENLAFKLYSLIRESTLLTEQDKIQTNDENTYEVPAIHSGEKANGSWECVNCSTVNKEGT